MSAFLQPLTMTRVFFAVAEKQPRMSLSDLFLFIISVLSPFSLLMGGGGSSSRAKTVVKSLQIFVSVFGAGCRFFAFLHLHLQI